MFCGRWLRKFVQGKRVGFLATMVLLLCGRQHLTAIAHWAGPRLSSYLYGAPQHFDLHVPLSGSVLQQQFRTVPMLAVHATHSLSL